jgi:hypothetical protein
MDIAITFPLSETVPDANQITAALVTAFNYISDTAAQDGSNSETHSLSFGKLLHILPAPIGQGGSLAAYDTANAKPELPTSGGLYAVVLFVEQANGLTRLITIDSADYTLDPSERLSLGVVSVEMEG